MDPAKLSNIRKLRANEGQKQESRLSGQRYKGKILPSSPQMKSGKSQEEKEKGGQENSTEQAKL